MQSRLHRRLERLEEQMVARHHEFLRIEVHYHATDGSEHIRQQAPR